MYKRLKELTYDADSDDNSEKYDKKLAKAAKKEVQTKEENEDYEYDKEGFISSKNIKEEKAELKTQQINSNKNFREVKYCGLCGKRVEYGDEFEKHMKSKIHKKNLKSSTLKDLEQYNSLKEYLLDKGLITNSKSKANNLRRLLYSMTLKSIVK